MGLDKAGQVSEIIPDLRDGVRAAKYDYLRFGVVQLQEVLCHPGFNVCKAVSQVVQL